MNKKEFMAVVAILESAYDKFNISNDDMKLNLWYEMLSDLDINECKLAVKKLISEFQFAPTIADIRKRIAEVRTGNLLTTEEAWGQVTKAISNYGYCREHEALESMDPNVRKTVESIGWQNICMTELDNQSALRGQFRAFYEAKTNKQKQLATMPESLRIEQNNLKQLTSGMFNMEG